MKAEIKWFTMDKTPADLDEEEGLGDGYYVCYTPMFTIDGEVYQECFEIAYWDEGFHKITDDEISLWMYPDLQTLMGSQEEFFELLKLIEGKK